MKLNITNQIFDDSSEHGNKRFERNVFTLLKRNGIFGEVVCCNAGVIDKFETFAIIEINKRAIQLTEKNIYIGKVETSKQKRNLFFEVLSNKIENLKYQLN
jgi:hypothetical protein